MKYLLMFVSDPAKDAELGPEATSSLYREVFAWFDRYQQAGQIVPGGAELHPPETATTVRSNPSGEPTVIDGPYSEAKEVIGGFCIAEVSDLEAALAMARTWPMLHLSSNSVEVRPIVEDYSQFEL